MSEQPEGVGEAEPSPPAPPARWTWFHKLTEHSLFKFTGWACTVIALIAWYVTREVPNLTFMVNPIRTAVVKSGQSSQLKVSHLGKEISGDVTAVQVAIWNDGKKSIRAGAILEPITLSISNAQIIEATMRRISRKVTGLALDETQIQSGRIGITWNILELGDGCSVQLIYVGSPVEAINLGGIIEGQRAGITKYRVDVHVVETTERHLWWEVPLLILCFCPLIVAFILANPLLKNKKQWQGILAMLSGAGVSTVLIALLQHAIERSGPPFGF